MVTKNRAEYGGQGWGSGLYPIIAFRLIHSEASGLANRALFCKANTGSSFRSFSLGKPNATTAPTCFSSGPFLMALFVGRVGYVARLHRRVSYPISAHAVPDAHASKTGTNPRNQPKISRENRRQISRPVTLYYQVLRSTYSEVRSQSDRVSREWLAHFTTLGEKLRVKVHD